MNAHMTGILLRSPTLLFAVACAQAANVSSLALAQTPASRYPVAPAAFADADEIALARSAAPRELSDSADIFTARAGAIIRIHRGSTGAACMVARDLHEGSVYPMCFNPEAARTVMQRELLQLRWRSLGVKEDSIDKEVDAAYADGRLKSPERFALAYMMSPRQVLFSSAAATGVRIGAWSPHLMIYLPRQAGRDVGLASPGAAANVFQFTRPGTLHSEFVVKVSHWSDGTPGPSGKR
jgi:hypothetical protein